MPSVAAVLFVLNEAGIVGDCIRNLMDEGVERVYVAHGASTDGTGDVLKALGVTVFDDDSPDAQQQYWIDRLSHIAFEDGADWVLPVDADEFWTGINSLADVGPEFGHVTATLWHHNNSVLKVVPAERLPKVAYRASLATEIGPGNHGVTNAGLCAGPVLEIRHWQYQGREHFDRKVEERNRRLSAVSRARGDGAHHTSLVTPADMDARWCELQARETVRDPIPFYRRHGLDTGTTRPARTGL